MQTGKQYIIYSVATVAWTVGWSEKNCFLSSSLGSYKNLLRGLNNTLT